MGKNYCVSGISTSFPIHVSNNSRKRQLHVTLAVLTVLGKIYKHKLDSQHTTWLKTEPGKIRFYQWDYMRGCDH